MERLYSLFKQCPSVSTDSRRCQPGDLFFALRGERFNANAFALEALEKGCRYAVVDEAEYATDDRFILVDDVLHTLQQLATYHRRQLNTPVVGITGSTGKTTTKELTASVLGERYDVLCTQGNLNNHIGVPLTLLQLRPEHRLAVVEMGANHPDDIAELCEIALPDYGLITNVGKAHLEGFGSLEGVKQAKGALYAFVARHGRGVFVNTDNPLLVEMTQKHHPRLRILPYIDGTVTAHSPFLSMTLQNGNDLRAPLTVNTRLVGIYNAENVRAAATIGRFFGLTDEQIIHGLEHYTPRKNRSQWMDTGRNHLIVDAYNANPVSMAAAIENFAQINEHNKVLILGQMEELGAQSQKEHRQIVCLIQEKGFDRVFLIGEKFKETHAKFPVFDHVDDLRHYLRRHKIEGCCVLIKGSRANQLEQVASDL